MAEIVTINAVRITPACAGKSDLHQVAQLVAADHPRLRGEKPFGLSIQNAMMGSPPPARGKGLQRVKSSRHAGITPACAGKSVSIVPPAAKLEDHPRLRGEKRRTKWRRLRTEGSPPPARGKVKL